MVEDKRATAREIAWRYLAGGDSLGCFEELYSKAGGNGLVIPWADMAPNSILIDWLENRQVSKAGKTALVIGCGLGDDAEELARRGFDTTAFDISPTAIAWCRRRFPESCVHYMVTDLFEAPPQWRKGFDFVIESYTLQVLPEELRRNAVREIAGFVKPGGMLLVIARGREATEFEGTMPWPLTREDLEGFRSCGLVESAFEDFMDHEEPPVRRFRGVYERRE